MYFPSKWSRGCREMLRSSETLRVFKHRQLISRPIGQILAGRRKKSDEEPEGLRHRVGEER